MSKPSDSLPSRSINPASVNVVGNLTDPPTFGVYRLPTNHRSTKRFRIGNYQVRMFELEREFGECSLEYLFTHREDAVRTSEFLNSLS